MEGMQWWGYLHSNGTIQVKRYYTGYRQDCDESDFVVTYTNPFTANTRADALEIVMEKLITKRKLKPGHYTATVQEVVVKENGNVDVIFNVEGVPLRLNIYKEKQNG